MDFGELVLIEGAGLEVCCFDWFGDPTFRGLKCKVFQLSSCDVFDDWMDFDSATSDC